MTSIDRTVIPEQYCKLGRTHMSFSVCARLHNRARSTAMYRISVKEALEKKRSETFVLVNNNAVSFLLESKTQGRQTQGIFGKCPFLTGGGGFLMLPSNADASLSNYDCALKSFSGKTVLVPRIKHPFKAATVQPATCSNIHDCISS